MSRATRRCKRAGGHWWQLLGELVPTHCVMCGKQSVDGLFLSDGPLALGIRMEYARLTGNCGRIV